jgi:Activator of Hsp90 ATPase homolog 1-like protein
MSRTDTAVRVISASPDRVYGSQQIEFVSEDPAFHGTMTMTWEVTAVDARSRVDIRADDVPEGINAADHAAGLSSSLDNLAAYVER